ncbi:MAG: hypothetical protein HYW25_02965 [Candidatus Aenigmarchaeota archaeon]|nr:hypothetical protein [Candidatus Aenigmarchaeota archaeon]
MKLFYVSGIRHNAIVLAKDGDEAVSLAIRASESEDKDPNVLFGSVGSWESPDAHELKLPDGYRLVNE